MRQIDRRDDCLGRRSHCFLLAREEHRKPTPRMYLTGSSVSELKPCCELQHSRPAVAETWIPLRDIQRLRREATGTLSQGLLKCEARSCRRRNHAARQRKLRMIENIEEFSAKLEIQPLGQLRILRQRKIDIPKSGAVDGVATKIPEIACGGGEGERIDIAVRGIAAKNLVRL